MKKIINVCFAFGAAIVIFGAWQKITHREYADISLSIGLLTEVVLFVIMGIQEIFLKEEPHNVPLQKGDSTELSAGLSDLNKTLKQIFNR